MTEEELKALQDAKAEAERRASEALAAAEAARQEAEKAKADVAKVVEELTAERKKKQEALEKANITNETPDVNSLVEQALAKKAEEQRKRELEDAIAEFRSSKPEFQADTTGVVFEKFKDGLKRFNFSDVDSKEKAKQRLDEAYRFLNATTHTEDNTNYDGSPRSGHNAPDKSGDMNPSVKSVLETARISEEKFTKLKGKYSEALEGLGIQ